MKPVKRNSLLVMNNLPAKQAGFSLIELMIASVIGLVLLSGVVTIFSSNSASSKMSTGMSRIQDSGRVALDVLSYNLRMTGYAGCRDEAKDSINVLATEAPSINFPNNAIWGSRINNSGSWTTSTPHPDLTNLINNSNNPIQLKPNTDVLYIQHGSGRAVNLLNDMGSDTDSLVLPRNPDQFDSGDLLMIADCSTSDIFRASNVTTAAGSTTIEHGTSTNSQGNLTKAYRGTGNANAVPVRVMRFEAKAYFIGDSTRNMPDGSPVWSLFEFDTTVAPVEDQRPVEIIEGVENFQVRYGIRPNAGTASAIRYITAANITDPLQVVSVQFGMLMGTADLSAPDTDTRTYDIAGWTIGPPSQTNDDSYQNDRRLRAAFNATVQIRNKTLSLDL